MIRETFIFSGPILLILLENLPYFDEASWNWMKFWVLKIRENVDFKGISNLFKQKFLKPGLKKARKASQFSKR